MAPLDDQRPPEQRPPEDRPSKPAVPSRTLSTLELEAVIRRAVELQAGGPGRTEEEGVSEVDVVRIGQELGLEPATVRRAMAEVRSRRVEEQGALSAAMGPGRVRATRVVERPATGVSARLEAYLRETELMVPQRRFPDRTRYVRDTSMAAGLTRFTRGLSRSHEPLDLKQLDVAVSELDGGSCLVEASSDMTGARAGHAAGGLAVGGSLAAGLAVTVWATPVADPLMLLGIPVLAGSWYGMRAIYGAVRRSAQEKLESLLDRVQHDDLAP